MRITRLISIVKCRKTRNDNSVFFLVLSVNDLRALSQGLIQDRIIFLFVIVKFVIMEVEVNRRTAGAS